MYSFLNTTCTIWEGPLSPHAAVLVLPPGPPARTCALDHICAALVESIRVWWREKREILQSEDALPVFLVIWLMVPSLFFSFSASKLPGYILLALPAGTLLAGGIRSPPCADPVADDDRPSLLLIVLHSVVASLPVVAALMMQYIVFHHALPWGRATAISAGFAAVLAIGITLTLRRPLGLRALRFVTLVPVVLAVGAALRLGAPSLDATLSARPLAQEISHVDNRSLPASDSAAFTRDRIWPYLLSRSEDPAL